MYFILINMSERLFEPEREGIVLHAGWLSGNRRVYDLLTGQFLSPDNGACPGLVVIQAPDFTQSFNRYGYCLNNPLVYTDPDGELAWFIPIIAGAILFGGGNVTIHASQGDIDNFWKGLGYFAQGAVAGAIVGATWSFGLASLNGTGLIGGGSIIQGMNFASQGLAQYAGCAIMGCKAINTLSTITSMCNNFENAGKILLGRTYFDKQIGHGFLQSLTRYTWEGLQTWIGYNYTQLRNTVGKVDKVKYFWGATFAIDENVTRYNGWRGVSFGNYINAKIPGTLDEDYPGGWIYSEGGLFWHEYGHTFDSQLYGLSYLLSIGLPSASGAEWTERRANNWAWKYAERHKYMDEWMYPDEYPLK